MGGTQQVLKGILLDLWVHANVRGRQLVWVVASTQLSTNKSINCLLSVQPCHWWGPAYQTQLQIHKCIYKYTNTQIQIHKSINCPCSFTTGGILHYQAQVQPVWVQTCSNPSALRRHMKRSRKEKQAHQLCNPATGRAVHTKHILSASIGGVMIKLEEAKRKNSLISHKAIWKLNDYDMHGKHRFTSFL